MIARLTYVHRPLWVRLLRPLAVWYLRDDIASAEQWVKDLRAVNYPAADVARIESNIGPKRALLAWWQAQ